VEPNRELMLEDARSIREGVWRMTRVAHDATEGLDARIEENLDGVVCRRRVCVDGVPQLQQTPSGFAPCLPVMAAKK
jgi:hypothetical protein